jgi:hypothetical protein
VPPSSTSWSEERGIEGSQFPRGTAWTATGSAVWIELSPKIFLHFTKSRYLEVFNYIESAAFLIGAEFALLLFKPLHYPLLFFKPLSSTWENAR